MLGCFRKWFGDDGEMISQPDPRRMISFHLPVFDEVNPALDIEYKPVNICVCLYICTYMYVQRRRDIFRGPSS